MNSKFHFHNHVTYIFSHCIRLLGLVCSVMLSFSYLKCLYLLYLALVGSKLEYSSGIWNSVMCTKANKLNTPAEICNLFLDVHCSNDDAFDQSKLYTLHKRMYQPDSVFLIHLGSKSCLYLLETAGLEVPAQYIRFDFVQYLLFK
jgi:hypothetical protein